MFFSMYVLACHFTLGGIEEILRFEEAGLGWMDNSGLAY